MTKETENGIVKTYQMDKVGNRTASNVGGIETAYTYDALNRLTGVTFDGGSASYTYDKAGRLLSETKGGIDTTYTYNKAGWLTKKKNTVNGGNTNYSLTYFNDGNVGDAGTLGTCLFLHILRQDTGVHSVAVGQYHTSVVIMVDSSSEFWNNDNFTNETWGGKIRFATIGAGPIDGRLRSDNNRKKDVMLDIKKQMINLNVSDTATINNLFTLEGNFHNDTSVDYERQGDGSIILTRWTGEPSPCPLIIS